MGLKEITLGELRPQGFIDEQVKAIRAGVPSGLAINALSGGVDSSVVTLLGHRALGNRLKTYFIENGLMREGEPEQIVGWFRKLGVPVEVVDAQDKFFAALKGVTDPEEKREKGITQVFYKDVFAGLVRKTGAKVLLQGTNFTDVEETVAGVKRQHNVLAQLGIDTQEEFGYKVIEPIIQLAQARRAGRRAALGLPEEINDRPPFPGPALCARVIGEVTRERVETVRKATRIVEEELPGQRRLPVPGDPPRGHGHRHAQRQARLRPADRGPLLGQHGRRDGHADVAAGREAARAGGANLDRGPRRRQRDLQHHRQAAELHRGRLTGSRPTSNTPTRKEHTMPRRDDIHKVMIIGSGPIVIGQACEFDYSGTQACKALRALGYKIVLVNSNPATIMTDPGMADVTYIEPLNCESDDRDHRQGTPGRAAAEPRRPDGPEPLLGARTSRACSTSTASR